MAIRIGISGWNYPPWRGLFYPKKLIQRKELMYASRRLSTIEINATFYSLQKPESFQKWHDQTPDDFMFAVKGGKFITHVKRLKEVEQGVHNFFGSGILALEQKLGPILWQFAPFMKLKDDRFEKFAQLLPKNSDQAMELAMQHNEKIAHRALTECKTDFPIRHAFEFRHDSFVNEDFLAMLKENNIAVVFADSGGKWPYVEKDTGDFSYFRMHGDAAREDDGYDRNGLEKWANKIKKFAETGDVYCYFDNDEKAKAPQNARELMDLLGIEYSPDLEGIEP